jgi:hypothetical protein
MGFSERTSGITKLIAFDVTAKQFSSRFQPLSRMPQWL